MKCIGHNQCGVQDTDGNWLIQPLFPWLSPFSEGLAVFTATYEVQASLPYLRGPYGPERRTLGSGVINRQGEIVVPLGKYKSIESYSHGLARVDDSSSNDPRYIDTNGNLVEDFLLPLGEPSSGLQLVWNKDGKYGYVKAR